MEQFEEHIGNSVPLGIAEEAPELESEFQEPEHLEEHAGSDWTDDPVRVYLREMGSVRLLSREGEIDLARRMERGKYRLRKALSRSPLVWKRVLSLYEDVRQENVRLDELVELGGPDDEARE